MQEPKDGACESIRSRRLGFFDEIFSVGIGIRKLGGHLVSCLEEESWDFEPSHCKNSSNVVVESNIQLIGNIKLEIILLCEVDWLIKFEEKVERERDQRETGR